MRSVRFTRKLFTNTSKLFSYCNHERFMHNNFVPLFANAPKFEDKVAIRDNTGNYTYGEIFNSAKGLSLEILKRLHGKINERVLFLCSNDVNYVITLWAIWMSGQIAVPLSPLHPDSLLSYYASDTNSRLFITTPEHEPKLSNLSKETRTDLFILENPLKLSKENDDQLPLDILEYTNAFILYTSGTTGKPKGVVLSHKNLLVQTESLINAWRWREDDVILHTLPLHHIHGTVNALFCPLFVGATTVMLPRFSAKEVWSQFLGSHENNKITVFTAVPTIYAKLIEEFEKTLSTKKEAVKTELQRYVRLMMSGSAPLPVPLYNKWLDISGHRLLERYGMTEIGMCLSNEYDSDREPGYVGLPLQGVSVRIAERIDDDFKTLLECTNDNGTYKFNKKPQENVSGELLVQGDNVFQEYYNKPEITKSEFFDEVWFKTGDICEYSMEKNKFKILGRSSVDIIKSGGYKISSLQIETQILAHPGIKECVIVGVKDDVFGEKVAAITVPNEGFEITLDSLKEWASDKMPKYCLPTILKVVDSIPKNAMGKVNKKEIVKDMFLC